MALPRVLCRVRLFKSGEFSACFKYQQLCGGVGISQHFVQRQPVRRFRTHPSSVLVLNKDFSNKSDKEQDKDESSSSSSSDSDRDSDSEDNVVSKQSNTKHQASKQGKDVTVEYHKGLPQITVPLPSRKERCRFTLKPISNTVGDFLEMLKNEDKGIDRVVIKARDGTRIASSNTIENLLDDDFRLTINDCTYNVNTPTQERLTGEEVQKLSDVKNLVSQLYEALQVREHHLTKEVELTTQLETLQQELLPLEEKKLEIEMVAHRKGNWLAWVGLGMMSVQFGILARLTWWEYSWDIMEPVTYFVTYGTAMAAYAYYVLTKEEYILADVRDRQHLLTLHKRAKKLGLDLNQYNTLKDQVAKIDVDLRRLRKKRDLHFPLNINGQLGALATACKPTDTATDTATAKDAKPSETTAK